MRQTDVPNANAAILLYLLFVVALVDTFAAVGYWLSRPTELIAVPYEPPAQRASLFLEHVSADASQEEVAIAVAREENLAQGLPDPTLVAEQQEPEPAPVTKTAAAPKSTVAAKLKRSPPKQVVRVTRRPPAPVPEARDAWAFSPFGSWIR